MKKSIYFLVIFGFLMPIFLFSKPGDVNIVRTIDFQQRRIGWFDFPTDNKTYEKILLHFKLRCPPGKPCGEWDYLSYVNMNQWFAPSFRANSKVVDTLRFMKDTSWNYSQIIVDGEKQIKKTAKDAIIVEFYNDNENPTKLSKTMTVFPTYYDNYKFDDNGKAIDSSFVKPDSILIMTKKRVYYNDDITFKERWELFRYITPYGNGLTLGDGVTWTFDVTDFATLLKGKVHLDSPYGGWGDPYDNNAYEDLELTFEFVEGTPPRNIINVKQLWNFYGLTYDKDFEKHVAPYSYTFNENEKTAKMRVTQTGHGFGGTKDNCAEFCRKLGMAKVDGEVKYQQYVWRECASNPIYPQGGTWIYDRSNWCPGAEVNPYDYEITPFLKHGTEQSIDYDMEFYDLNWTGGDNTKPNWVLTGYLFTYGDINFNNDARITKIIAPNNDRLMNRFNPICGSPIIEIQNVGKNDISEVKIKYGNDIKNLAETTVTLPNSISFMEKIEIELPNNNCIDDTKGNVFYAEIEEVNDKSDDYELNNKLSSRFELEVPEFSRKFTIELSTPNSNILGISSPISYYLEDMNGNLIYSKNSTENSKVYKDELELEDGCYKFTIVNSQGFGLGFWAFEPDLKRGYLRFSMNGNTFKTFPTDWGNFYSIQFRVGDLPEMLTNVESDTLKYGDVLLGEKIVKTIELSPKNDKGIKINNLSIILGTGKKFEIVKTEPEPINGVWDLKFGEKLKIDISFEPLSEGIKTSPLRIASNDFYNWQKDIVLQGRGRDPLGVENNITNQLDIKLEAIYSINNDDILLKIALNDIGNSANISIYDILGKKVLELPKYEINNYLSEQSIDANLLNAGVYYINFVYQGAVKNIPILINK